MTDSPIMRDELDRMAITITSFLAAYRPGWLDMIRDQLLRGVTYEQWKEHFDKFSAEQPQILAVYGRLKANGVDYEYFLRAMWNESRRLASMNMKGAEA